MGRTLLSEQCSSGRVLRNFTMESRIYANAPENKHFPLALWQKVSEKERAMAAAGITLKKTTWGQELSR